VAGEANRPSSGEPKERLAPLATPVVPRLDDRYELTDRTGLSLGPIPLTTLQGLIRQGRLFRTDRVAKNGQLALPLGELPEFQAVFREVLPLEFHVGHEPLRPRPELSGTLDRVALVEVFIRLFKERRTGRLFLSSPDRKQEKVIIFRDGLPVNAMSNIQDEALGEMLIHQGLIDQGTFDQAVEVKRQKGSRIGSALLALEVLSPRDLHRALARQAMERLLRAFRQREGTFHFVADESAVQEDILLFADPREIAEAGLHASLTASEVAEELNAYGDPVLQTRQKALEEDWARTLTDDDRQILELLRAPQPLGSVLPRVAKAHRLTTEEARLRLLTLLKLGAVALGEETLADLEKMLGKLQGLDWFQVLGVARTEESAKIHEAHQQRLERCGALPQPGDTAAVTRLRERIKQILDEAARTLADPDERSMYERALLLGLDIQQPEVRQRIEYDYFVGRGRSLLAAQKYAEAREAFIKASERMADEPMVYVNLGWAQFLGSARDVNAAREAIRQVERALKLAGDLDQAYLTIGKIHRLSGAQTEAELNLRKAVELNPQNSEAQSELRLIFTRDINASRTRGPKLEMGGPLAGVIAVAVLVIAGLFFAANYGSGGATTYPEEVKVGALAPRSLYGTPPDEEAQARVVPPEWQHLGNTEYFYLPQDSWWWIRRGALLGVGLLGMFLVARRKPREIALLGPNPAWMLVAIPYGMAIGFLSPVQTVSTPAGTLLGMAAFHVLAEQVFFVWFVCFGLMKHIAEPLAAVAITAVLYGAYHLSYMHIFHQQPEFVARDALQIGAFAGGAYAALAWRSGGLLAPLLAHLAVMETMMIHSVAAGS
jgi:tetratricopeptide (TPR) repeat protein/membrane protease YdiL (CAAX protease family)